MSGWLLPHPPDLKQMVIKEKLFILSIGLHPFVVRTVHVYTVVGVQSVILPFFKLTNLKEG